MANLQEVQADADKLSEFIGQLLADLGGAASVPLVRMGDALGLYKILHRKGPMTTGELAEAAKVDVRYLREWLAHQAASSYLAYDPASEKFSLPPEQAMVFANEGSPAHLLGGFDLMSAMLDNRLRCRRRSNLVKASRGGIKRHACSARLHAFSDRVTTTTSLRRGSRPSTACAGSSSAVRRWPMSDAVMAGRPC
jgi:hypothetical protein